MGVFGSAASSSRLLHVQGASVTDAHVPVGMKRGLTCPNHTRARESEALARVVVDWVVMWHCAHPIAPRPPSEGSQSLDDRASSPFPSRVCSACTGGTRRGLASGVYVCDSFRFPFLCHITSALRSCAGGAKRSVTPLGSSLFQRAVRRHTPATVAPSNATRCHFGQKL